MATNVIRSRSRYRTLAALAALAAFAGSAALAQPVAVVTDVRGGVTSGVSAPLAILAQVNVGDRIRLAAGGSVSLLFYADGAQIDTRGPGEIVIDAAGPRPGPGAIVEARGTPAKAAVRLKPGGLVQGAMVMRNLGLRVVAPEPQVLAVRPLLAWTDSRSEASYDVALIDAAGARVFERSTPDRVVALPESVSLRPGDSYAVEVIARVQGAVVQVARAEFRIATEELRSQARALAPAPNSTVAERVAYALWLEQNDLRDEARKWWKELADSRPEQDGLRERAGMR